MGIPILFKNLLYLTLLNIPFRIIPSKITKLEIKIELNKGSLAPKFIKNTIANNKRTSRSVLIEKLSFGKLTTSHPYAHNPR